MERGAEGTVAAQRPHQRGGRAAVTPEPLAGKVAFVARASRGIGRDIAVAPAAAVAAVAITTSGVRMIELGSNAYWVSKAGVERYYIGLATELQSRNIAVNCLAPSKVVITEGWLAAGSPDLPDDMIEPPDGMARAAVYL